VRQLKIIISELNSKISQMKSEFGEERIMGQSKIFEIMKTSGTNHKQQNSGLGDHDKENSRLYLQTANSVNLENNSEFCDSNSKYATMKKSSEKIKISDAHFHQDASQEAAREQLEEYQRESGFIIEKLKSSLARSEKKAHNY